MTQQVVRALLNFKMVPQNVRKPTMDFIFEQRGSDTNVNPTSLFNQLHTFFDVQAGTMVRALTSYMSPAIAWTDAQVMHTRLYDITGKLNGTTPAGSPIAEDFYKPTHPPSGSATALPLEVACACSYRSDYGTDPEFGLPTGNEKGRFRPRATHRGRFFLGPLNVLATGNDANNCCVFTATFIADLEYAMTVLTQGPSGTNDITGMVQWSRKNQRVSPITKIDVNNDPDIRRLRGLKAPTHTW